VYILIKSDGFHGEVQGVEIKKNIKEDIVRGLNIPLLPDNVPINRRNTVFKF